jgi:hypothetical protein
MVVEASGFGRGFFFGDRRLVGESWKDIGKMATQGFPQCIGIGLRGQGGGGARRRGGR